MSRGDGKDERGTSAYESRQKDHHEVGFRGAAPPDVIVRTVQGSKKKFNVTDDSFGANSSNVPYSLNKGKRWEKVDGAKDHLPYKDDGSVTFVQRIIRRQNAGIVNAGVIASDDKVAAKMKGGVSLVAERTSNGEVLEKIGKSARTTLESLQGNSDPGPYSRRERRIQKEQKMMENLQGDEQPSSKASQDDSKNVRYTVVKLTEPSAEMKESAWRKQQKTGRARVTKHRTTLEDDEDDLDDFQDDLEQQLDEEYELQLDTDRPLEPPISSIATKKQPKKKTELTEEEVIEHKRQERHIKKLETDEMMLKEEQLKQYEYLKTRVHPREELPEKPTHEMIESVKRLMTSETNDIYLPCLPTTIIFHAQQTKEVFGHQLDHPVLVRDLGTRMALYKAFNFSCETHKPEQVCNDGWNVLPKSTLQKLEVCSSPPESAVLVLSACAICSKKEEDLSFFGMPCGHLACETCWIEHCLKEMSEERVPIRCLKADCKATMSVTQFATLIDDQGVSDYVNLLWEKNAESEGTVKCAACSNLFVRDESERHPSPFVACPCGIRTCASCQWRAHLPLTCEQNYAFYRLIYLNFFEYSYNPDLTAKPNGPQDFVLTTDCLQKGGQIQSCRSCMKHTMQYCTRNYRTWCSNCGENLLVPEEFSLTITSEIFTKSLWPTLALGSEDWKSHAKNLRIESASQRRVLGGLVHEAAHMLQLMTLRSEMKWKRELPGVMTAERKAQIIKAEEDLSTAYNLSCVGSLSLAERLSPLERAMTELRKVYENTE